MMCEYHTDLGGDIVEAAQPTASDLYVVVHAGDLIVNIPLDLDMQGPEAITQWLRTQGYAVENKEDWHISYRVPGQP